MVRRRLGLSVVLALAAAGCSSSGSTGETTAAATAPTTVATTAPTTVATTATPVTAVATAPTPAPTSTVPPAAVVPEVICGTADPLFGPTPTQDGYYFGYTNDGTQPVAIAAGPDNELTDAFAGDQPYAPTVFAPGRVAPVFLVLADDNVTLPSWRLRGPDGVVRVATPDQTTPRCGDIELVPTTEDLRSPGLDVVLRGLPEGADPTQVEIVATVTDVPALSVCPDGLEPEPVQLSIAPFDRPRVEGPSITVTADVLDVTRLDRSYRGGVERFQVFVADRCSGAGAVTITWPVAPTLEALIDGRSVCFEIIEGIPEEIDCGPGLPATGGIRSWR